MRLFFALPCPAPLAQRIAAWREARGVDGHLVDADNLHLTLTFLGDFDAERLDELIETAGTLHGEAFELSLQHSEQWRDGLWCLRPHTTPQAMEQLFESLRERLSEIGVPQERRRFRPHVTLARQTQQPVPQPPAFAWPVRRFALFTSERPNGRVNYRELASWPLH